MNPSKEGRFDIHFHRRDAELAEDSFKFFAFRVWTISMAEGSRD